MYLVRSVALAAGLFLAACNPGGGLPGPQGSHSPWTGPGWYVVATSDAPGGTKTILRGPRNTERRCYVQLNDANMFGETRGYHGATCESLAACPSYACPGSTAAATPGTAPAPTETKPGETKPAEANAAGQLCARLPGLWEWAVLGDVVIKPDGTATQLAWLRATGTWTCANNQVVVSWPLGFADRMTLSADGNGMDGSGGWLSTSVSAHRKPAAPAAAPAAPTAPGASAPSAAPDSPAPGT